MTEARRPPHVAIVGGGLAGLSAAVYLSERDACRVTLFEARSHLGGQAGSWHDADGDAVETGIHLAFPWYENFVRLYRDVGRPLELAPTDGNYYICDGRSGRVRTLYDGRAAWKTLFGLATFPGLTPFERLKLARLCWDIMRMSDEEAERWDAHSVEAFLRARRLEGNIMRQMALATVTIQGLRVDEAGAASFIKFMRTLYGSVGQFDATFFAAPLQDALVGPLEEHLARHGVAVRRGTRVTRLEVAGDRVAALHTDRDERHADFDWVILAVPGYLVPPLLPEPERQAPPFDRLSRLEGARVITLQLWYDQRVFRDGNVRISNRDGVVFDAVADKAFHWRRPELRGSVLQVLIDASDDVAHLADADMYQRVLADLDRFFPACRAARPRKWQLLRHRDIYCETRPGYWSLVPRRHETSLANLLLAGDYTDGPYHYGMESAVISGKRVAGIVLREHAAKPDPVLPVRYIGLVKAGAVGAAA